MGGAGKKSLGVGLMAARRGWELASFDPFSPFLAVILNRPPDGEGSCEISRGVSVAGRSFNMTAGRGAVLSVSARGAVGFLERLWEEPPTKGRLLGRVRMGGAGTGGRWAA